MPGRQSHLIERHVFELTVADSRGALEWERKASGFQERVIGPAVEESFRNFAHQDRHLIIRRLEIDLGTFSRNRFEKEARVRLTGMLGERLRTLYRNSNLHAFPETFETAAGAAVRPNSAPRAGQSPSDEMPLVAGDARADYLAFIYFLSRGSLPWWYDGRDVAPVSQDQFPVEWISVLGSSESVELKQTLQANSQARIRLTSHFSDEWISEFLQRIGLSGDEGMKLWAYLHPLVDPYPGLRPSLHQNFWMAWMMTSPGGCPDVTTLLEQTARGDRKLFAELASALREMCLEKSANLTASSPARLMLNQLQDFRDPLNESEKSGSPRESDQDEDGDHEFRSARSAITPIDRPREGPNGSGRIASQAPPGIAEDSSRAESGREEAGLFVQSAGLVLLHPFLPELFERTELWDGKAWRTEQAGVRATQLLSYLASGDVGLAEYRLHLHKLLAGVEMEVALTVEAPLTLMEIEACEELLRAVIGHWKALGSTSSDGLREAFLQREGKLESTANGFRLQVERKAQDVLLSHLTWGYALVKLPWMTSMLHVTWI